MAYLQFLEQRHLIWLHYIEAREGTAIRFVLLSTLLLCWFEHFISLDLSVNTFLPIFYANLPLTLFLSLPLIITTSSVSISITFLRYVILSISLNSVRYSRFDNVLAASLHLTIYLSRFFHLFLSTSSGSYLRIAMPQLNSLIFQVNSEHWISSWM